MKKLRNIIALLIIYPLLMPTATSQNPVIEPAKPKAKEIRYPNIVKVNSLAILFSNIALAYERGIVPRVSAGIGVGYKYAGGEPKLFTVNDAKVKAHIDKITGYSITPEARYYIKSCDPGQLDGFYAGLYLRYTHYKSGANFEYTPSSNIPEVYDADVKLNEYGVGIQLGYQLIIKERFSIDFLFFGPRFSNYNLAYEFDKQPSEEFLNDLSDYLNEVVDRLGFDYTVNVNKDGESSASTGFSFANMRFGLSLGFAF
jgi:hypothetical protein